MFALKLSTERSKRALAALIGGAVALLLSVAGPAHSEEAKPAAPYQLTGDLAVAGKLGDEWLGKADAPVTIIEYASMTCPHCAHFHETAFPELKSKYIDTGKVRFALREFPFDPVATAAFMLGHCSGEGHYYALIGLLFAQQKNWATDRAADDLLNTVKQAGFTQDSFNACLKDQRIYDAVNDVKNRGEKLGVDATPTFFINGKKMSGALTIKELDAAIEPLLPK